MAVVVTHIPSPIPPSHLWLPLTPSPHTHVHSQSTMSATSLHSLASCTSSISRHPRSHALQGALRVSIQSLASSFNGEPINFRLNSHFSRIPLRRRGSMRIKAVKPSIQFIPGTDERTVPDVKLTKSRDGTNGQAIFKFDEPSVFDSSSEVGDITGFFMIDEEGTLQSVDVSARFINGKPAGIEAKYVMRTPRDWDRFMRFMERYANANGLSFVKS